jgi:hypothetical protein
MKLTEEQKQHNIKEGINKLVSIVLEKIILDGGLNNVKQNKNT